METLKLYRHFYNVQKELKQYTVYKLEGIINYHDKDGIKFIKPFSKPQPTKSSNLTKLLRIEKYRGYSKGKGFNEYLRLRDTKNWNKCKQVTGLHFTIQENIYFGEYLINKITEEKDLLIFHFNHLTGRLIIDYYANYYPRTKDELDALIDTYKD